MADPFIWSNAKVPFTIKKGDDDPNAQDLETSTTRAEPEKKARLLIRARTGNQNEPNEYYCLSAIETRIGNGGAEPLNLAQFFLRTRLHNMYSNVRTIPFGPTRFAKTRHSKRTTPNW
jgi:hypothetical protein